MEVPVQDSIGTLYIMTYRTFDFEVSTEFILTFPDQLNDSDTFKENIKHLPRLAKSLTQTYDELYLLRREKYSKLLYKDQQKYSNRENDLINQSHAINAELNKDLEPYMWSIYKHDDRKIEMRLEMIGDDY